MEAEEASSLEAIEKLDLPPEVKATLRQIQAEMMAMYSAQATAMAEAINNQSAILLRIQKTLDILVNHLEPQLPDGKLPVAFQVGREGEQTDVAKALVVADPIGMGFTLSQSDVAQALGITRADLSILFKAFKLKDDARCAVTVRQGRGTPVVNYSREVIDLFLERMRNPPQELDDTAASALKRVRKKLQNRLES
jgi:hypothetical protein